MIRQLKHLDYKGWLYGLVSAVIGGGASAVSAAIGASWLAPDKFNLSHPADIILLMLITFVVNGMLSMFLYLKQSPLPPIVEEVRAIKTEGSQV
jgi:hypothetical protein